MQFIRVSIIAISMIFLTYQPAFSGDWFLHKFGELRSYHGDWLNVCSNSGKGQCRAVQIPIKEGQDSFFGDSRLALIRIAEGKYALEVYDVGMPKLADGNISFEFDGEQIALNSGQWRVGSFRHENVLETFAIDEPELMTKLVDLIRRKNNLVIQYAKPGGSAGLVKFSLRGSSAALDAIEKHIASIN